MIASIVGFGCIDGGGEDDDDDDDDDDDGGKGCSSGIDGNFNPPTNGKVFLISKGDGGNDDDDDDDDDDDKSAAFAGCGGDGSVGDTGGAIGLNRGNTYGY